MQGHLSGLFLAFIIFAPPAFADQPAINHPRVFVDDYGWCVAHSVPHEKYGGSEGKTHIYLSSEKLELINVYDWYSTEIFIRCDVLNDEGGHGPLVVMTGSWSTGTGPSEDDLALAFYHNGQLIRRFSTLDIAESDKKNASCSVGHYRVVSEYLGFTSNPWTSGNLKFHLRTVDGRELIFDAPSGEIIRTEQSTPDEIFGQCPD